LISVLPRDLLGFIQLLLRGKAIYIIYNSLNLKKESMKNLILLLTLSALLVSCEKDEIIPPDTIEYFTDITYEVSYTGDNLTPNINYGDLKYSLPNYPDSLVWNYVTVSNAVLPWSKTFNTCVGHPVRMGAIVGGTNRTMTFKIYNNAVLVASKTFESNGFLWGGNLEYNIPNPQ
jgi:hypothetical protein